MASGKREGGEAYFNWERKGRQKKVRLVFFLKN